jgi:hypothetical protein
MTAQLAPQLPRRATRDQCAGWPTVPQTSATFPTQYVGWLVFKPIMAELTAHARREGLEFSASTRPRLLCSVVTVTVSGDANAVERFRWIIERVTSRYSMTAAMC